MVEDGVRGFLAPEWFDELDFSTFRAWRELPAPNQNRFGKRP